MAVDALTDVRTRLSNMVVDGKYKELADELVKLPEPRYAEIMLHLGRCIGGNFDQRRAVAATNTLAVAMNKARVNDDSPGREVKPDASSP